MSPQAIAEHRKRIGFEVGVVLKTDYYVPDLSKEELAASLAGWCDALEDWPVDQIVWALNEHRNTRPDKRPNAGHILSILKRKRGEEYAAKAATLRKAADPAPVITEEARARAAARVAELFPSIAKRMPKVQE